MSHAVIGVWAVEIHHRDRPRVDRGTLLFHENGTMSMAFTLYAAHGVWQATGDQAVTVTGTRPVGPNEGFVGWFTLRGTASISADGRAIEMPAVESRPRPDGSLAEQHLTFGGSRLSIDGA